jgi:hypothetical protein
VRFRAPGRRASEATARSRAGLAGDDAVRLAKALCYVLGTLEARRREGKSLLGLDETVRMLVNGLRTRGAEFR